MLMSCSKTGTGNNNTLPEAETYLMPGYTGHCPTLKFRFGKRYAVNTREIIQDLSKYRISNYDLRLLNNYRDYYPAGDSCFPKFSTNVRTKQSNENSDNNNYVIYSHRKYILGYTGYIPGMCFRYGKSFCTLADECEKDSTVVFKKNAHSKIHQPTDGDMEIIVKSSRKGRPKLFENATQPIVDKTATTANNNNNKNNSDSCKYGNHNKISSKYPPISGYTGHIPLMKVSNLSVSRPYRDAAKIGLSLAKRKESTRR